MIDYRDGTNRNGKRTIQNNGESPFRARSSDIHGPNSEGTRRRREAESAPRTGLVVGNDQGMRELESGIACVDAYAMRGRKRAEERLPHLLVDMRAIVDSESQTDGSFKTSRLYTRLTAGEVRRQLIAGKIQRRRTAKRGSHSATVEQPGVQGGGCKQEQTQKKIAETDAIFAQIRQVNEEADQTATMLRISCDAKAAVNVGDFSHQGVSRVPVEAADHDFKSDAVVVPYGIFVPKLDELSLYLCRSKVTADCIVDCLNDWWQKTKVRFPEVTLLVINQDSGPENQSRRTQYMKRSLEFVALHQVDVRLAYYSPYHGKYNPVERCWGVLEQNWNGSLLSDLQTVVGFAQSMTWRGHSPIVEIVNQTYDTGRRLTQSLMRQVQTQLSRFSSLGRWFIDIRCSNLLQRSLNSLE